MKHQHHFDASAAALAEAQQLRTFIADLDSVMQILDAEIAAQEERAHVFDRSRASYPIIAKTLAERRDNLKATIAALQRRLAATDTPQADPVAA